MSSTKFSIFLSLILSASLSLSACGTNVGATSGWPGLATDGRLAFVASGSHIYAVDVQTHNKVWTFPVIPEGAPSGIFSFFSPSTPVPNHTVTNFFSDPGLSQDLLLVSAERPTNSHSGVLFGLDPSTGKAYWCLAFDPKGVSPQSDNPESKACQLVSNPVPSSDNRILGGVTISENNAYFGLANGWIYALEVNTSTVTVKWTAQAEHAVWGAPRVDEETVYVPSLDHKLYAFDRPSGSLKWKQDLSAALVGTPALDDGTLYLGSFGNKLYALDARTGDQKWAMPTHNWVWDGPTLQDGILYFTDLAGTVFAVDAESGRQKWAVTPGNVIRAAPAVITDTVFVGDKAGMLFALNIADGAVRWKQQISKGQLLGTPVVVNDLVLVTPYQGDNLLEAYQTSGSDAGKWVFTPSKK